MNGCTAQSQNRLPAMVAFKGTWSEPEFSSVMDLSSMLLQKKDESGPSALSAVESVRGKRDTVFCSNMETRFREEHSSGSCNARDSLAATFARVLPWSECTGEHVLEQASREKVFMLAPVRAVASELQRTRHACMLSFSTQNNRWVHSSIRLSRDSTTYHRFRFLLILSGFCLGFFGLLASACASRMAPLLKQKSI
jgi:hypothetical protein